MFDEEIREYGVGQYDAAWDKIQAEWYMEGPSVRKVELRQDGKHKGFAIAQEKGTHIVRYPHVYNMKDHMRMTFCLQGEKGASIEVLVDGEESGILRLDQDQPTLTEIGIPLTNSAGEHDMMLRMTGSVLIDWFRLTV